jgi:CBS-domain-containing membrane protein
LDLACTFVGAFCGILAVSAVALGLQTAQGDVRGGSWLVASFGASAVLVYGVPESKLAQPRNLIGEQGRARVRRVFAWGMAPQGPAHPP